MDITVRSLAWDSASSVIAWCLRSWKRKPAVELVTLLIFAPHGALWQISAGAWSSPHAGQFTARVSLRHAERQPLIGFVGSGFEYPSDLGKRYQSGCRSLPKRVRARSLSRMIA